MKQFTGLFLPSYRSFKRALSEVSKTSNSRVRFIDFVKVSGLLLVIFNTNYFLDFEKSSAASAVIALTTQDHIVLTSLLCL